METVYVDTNVLFNWLVAKNATLVKPATDFMKDLSNGKFSGVISDLAINELFKAIRNTLVKDGKTSPSAWEQEEKNALTKIYQLPKKTVKLVSGTSADCQVNSKELEFGSISRDACEIMAKNKGKVTKDRSGKPAHDGLSTADTLHVVLAKRFSCDKIASFDKDFDEVSTIMKSMVLKEAYHI